MHWDTTDGSRRWCMASGSSAPWPSWGAPSPSPSSRAAPATLPAPGATPHQPSTLCFSSRYAPFPLLDAPACTDGADGTDLVPLHLVVEGLSRCVVWGRYRKRGVNDAGRVANEVEIEQVVDAGFDWRTGFPLLASLVQVWRPDA